MKYLFLAIFALASIVPACAQTPKSPHETVSEGNISVTYGRPSKRDREIFGALVPYGQVWRAGADAATEIKFASDGSLGGQAVKAGTYTMFVLPTEKEWTIILNSQLKQWGAYEYDKHKDKDVLKVTVPVTAISSPVEMWTIRFDGGNMIMEWDKSQVSVPVK